MKASVGTCSTSSTLPISLLKDDRTSDERSRKYTTVRAECALHQETMLDPSSAARLCHAHDSKLMGLTPDASGWFC